MLINVGYSKYYFTKIYFIGIIIFFLTMLNLFCFLKLAKFQIWLIYENGKQCDYLLRYHQMLNFLKEQCCVKLYSVVLTIFTI